MTFSVGDYIFDRDRMLFYRQTLPDDVRLSIEREIPPGDDIEAVKRSLDEYIAAPCCVSNKLFAGIGICLTYNCQMRCNYCSFESEEKGGEARSLTADDAIAYVRKAMRDILTNELLTGKRPPLQVIFTGGGEPTYDWALFQTVVSHIVEMARRNDIEYSVEITTNGMLSEEQIAFIAGNVNQVMLSFDGLPDTQNANRRVGGRAASFEIADRSIRAFNKYGTRLFLRSTIWQKDFERMTDMAKFVCANYDFADWSVMPAMPQGRALSGDDFMETPPTDFFDSYIAALRYVRREYPEKHMSTPVFPNGETTYFCGALFTMCPWLLPNGKIVSCLEAYGNVSHIGEVSGGAVKFYDAFENRIAPVVRRLYDECGDCAAFRFCRGNCPLEAMTADRYFRKWSCAQIRRYYDFVFSKVLQGKRCLGWSARRVEGWADYEVLSLVPPTIHTAAEPQS